MIPQESVGKDLISFNTELLLVRRSRFKGDERLGAEVKEAVTWTCWIEMRQMLAFWKCIEIIFNALYGLLLLWNNYFVIAKRVYFDGVWDLVERGSFTDKRRKMGVLNPIIFKWSFSNVGHLASLELWKFPTFQLKIMVYLLVQLKNHKPLRTMRWQGILIYPSIYFADG